ncbi:MAG: DUF742 domain-containing protein [Pseudonocardiaceae bacterium]
MSPESDESASIVRPYARTGGRTRPTRDLALEAMVTTSDLGRDDDALIHPEHRSIAGLCEQARSVAEVAALLSLPLGVARVLLGDMAGMGLVVVHRTSVDEGALEDSEFLERVLDGLRRI